MKLKTITLLSILTMMSIPLGINSFNNHKNIVKAEPIPSKTIYVDLSLNDKYLEEGSNPYIRFSDGNDINVSLIKIDNTNIYKTNEEIPLTIFTNEEYGFEIGSFDGTYKTSWINGGDNNVLKENHYNYICLDHYIDNEPISVKGYGYYRNKESSNGATYLTQRVWLNNDNPYLNNDPDNWNYENVVGYYDDKSNYHLMTMTSIINLTDNRNYYYTDIPEYVSSIIFMRISKTDDNHNYLIYQSVNIDYLAYGVCYFAGLTSYDDYMNITSNNVSGATASMLHLVVESYLTYGKSSSNGCSSMTVRNLYNTWFKNKSASKDELKNEKILDYTGYSSNGNSYEGLTKNATFSVNEKWNTMCSQAGIDPNTGNIRSIDVSWLNNDMLKIVIILGIASVIVCGGVIALMIIRKRRYQ